MFLNSFSHMMSKWHSLFLLFATGALEEAIIDYALSQHAVAIKKNSLNRIRTHNALFLHWFKYFVMTIVITMNINDINEPKTQNSGTGVFPGHQRDKSHFSGTVPATPGWLAGM